MATHTNAVVHSGGHSRCCRGSPGGRLAAFPGFRPHPGVSPALPALSLPSPSCPVAPTVAPPSTGGPDLSPLPALATPIVPLPTSDAAPAPCHPPQPLPGRHPGPLPGREDSCRLPAPVSAPGPLPWAPWSRPSGAWHRVSTGHKGARRTSRQAGAKGEAGPASAPSPRCANASSRKLPVVWGSAPTPSHPNTPLYLVRVDRVHHCSFINSSTQEAVNASSK